MNLSGRTATGFFLTSRPMHVNNLMKIVHGRE